MTKPYLIYTLRKHKPGEEVFEIITVLKEERLMEFLNFDVEIESSRPFKGKIK